MACFLVPVTEAIVTTIATKVIESKEKKSSITKVNAEFNSVKQEADTKIPFSKKLKWINNLLWGGSLLLAFEHIWHGEVVPWFPFLTAAENAADAAGMMYEMATVGVVMSVLVTAVWTGMVLISNVIEKRAYKEVSPLVQEDVV